MPVLDGNMDMEYDARSLAASIKGTSRREDDEKEEQFPDAETLAGLIRGGGRKEGSRSQQRDHYVKSSPRPTSSMEAASPFQPIGITIPTPLGMISPSPMLMPGFYGGKSIIQIRLIITYKCYVELAHNFAPSISCTSVLSVHFSLFALPSRSS